MKTVILDIRPLSDTLSDFSKTWKSRKASQPRIRFESPEVLFKLLSGKRWELLQVLTGAGPVTIREAARRAKRDIKAVHGDMRALLNAGILQNTPDGRIVLPFDKLRIDFVLRAA
ncbi:MAG: DNA-binding protein [Chthoniobacterales bacterium]